VTIDTLGSLRLRAELAEARVEQLEGAIAAMQGNAAPASKYEIAPPPQRQDTKQ